MPTTLERGNASTCCFVAKNQVVLGGFRFFPSTSEMMTSHQGSINKDGIHDNIQLSRKHQRAVAEKPNNDPSWSSSHVECTTTESLRTSYRNAYQPNRALRALTSETFLLISRPGHDGNVFTIEFIAHDPPLLSSGEN